MIILCFFDQVDFIAHGPSRNAGREGGCRPCPIPRIYHPQHQIGRGRPLPRPPYTLLLHRIVAVTDASGIRDRDRIAIEIEMDLDHVTGRAGDR
jgi:hypothetical protein